MNDFDVKSRIEYLYPCSNTSSCHEISTYFDPGVYVFELFGAGGGNGFRNHTNKETIGGNGGYSRGCIKLTKRTLIHMFIGGKGVRNKVGETIPLGGFNGGGNGVVGKYKYLAGSGGGATDIRIGCKSLKCRKLVAGGGGGAGSPISEQTTNVGYGGSGGGSEGIDGIGYRYLTDDYKGTGASQTGPGEGGTLEYRANDGELGKGGSYNTPLSFDSGGGGGGGGYYGGGGSGAAGGGGGSGYLDPSITTINGISPVLIDGDTSMTDIYGNSYTGNKGNGFIHVTVLSRRLATFPNCRRAFGSFSFQITFVNILFSH